MTSRLDELGGELLGQLAGCVTGDELTAWVERARVAQPRGLAQLRQLFCDDCVLAYELEQRALGRCAKPLDGWSSAVPGIYKLPEV
mgnify:CR=1 FL=1